MLKSELLAAIQEEIHRHNFTHFVDEPPSIAQVAEASSWLAVLLAGQESIP